MTVILESTIIFLTQQTGLRENQTGDAFPADSNQWNDTDGDGYGDNPYGTNSDYCPSEFGNSTIDYIGCPDDDQDGHWNFKDAFPDEPTQWEDDDGDFVGDNQDGANPDLCPDTDESFASQVDEDGCAANQRDTDGDLIDDYRDPCPFEAEEDGGTFGCPADTQENGEFELFGLNMMTLIAAGGGVLLALILMLIVIRRMFSRGFDLDDDDDDEDYYDDDDEDDFMSSFYASSKPMPSRNATHKGSSQPARNAPRSPSGPPGRANSAPSGPPKAGPSARGPPGSPIGSGPTQNQTSFAEKTKPTGGPPGRGTPSRGPPGRGPPGASKAMKRAHPK